MIPMLDSFGKPGNKSIKLPSYVVAINKQNICVRYFMVKKWGWFICWQGCLVELSLSLSLPFNKVKFPSSLKRYSIISLYLA